MKIVKTAYQGANEAHETAFIIKGLFRKRVYRLDLLALVELPTIPLKGLPDEKA